MKKILIISVVFFIGILFVACGENQDEKASYIGGYYNFKASENLQSKDVFEKYQKMFKETFEEKGKTFSVEAYKQGWEDAKAGKESKYKAEKDIKAASDQTENKQEKEATENKEENTD